MLMTSGVNGYATACNTSGGEYTGTSVTEPLGTETKTCTFAEGTGNYFHVRTRDNVGNWDDTSNDIGPFWIDITDPSVPGVPVTNTTSEPTPTFSWAASIDAMSGLTVTEAYEFEWANNATFSGSRIVRTDSNSFVYDDVAYQPPFAPLEDGDWYFRVRAWDKANNVSDWSSTGSVTIDASDPVCSVSINGGESYVASKNVSLTITRTKLNALEMAVNHSEAVDSWESFDADYPWILDTLMAEKDGEAPWFYVQNP